MSEQQEPGNRMVSKGRYIQFEASRIGRALLGGCLLIVAMFCAIMLFCIVLNVLGGVYSLRVGNKDYSDLVVGGLLIPFFCALTYFFYKWANRLFLVAENMPSVVPLTRANIDYLPLPDSLVRASQGPLQAQEAILLRTAAETSEKHEEQLLRASTGIE